MKIALIALAICSVSSLPAPDEEESQLREFGFSNIGWQYYLCELQCRTNCWAQGYWAGACTTGLVCQCYKKRNPFVQEGGLPVGF